MKEHIGDVTEMITAVEWLVKKILGSNVEKALFENEIKQAKEMEKQQIIDAYQKGRYSGQTNWGFGNEITAEQYFNETY